MKKNFQTSIILINGMATNNEKQRTKGFKQYDKAVEKNTQTMNPSLNEWQQQQKKRGR